MAIDKKVLNILVPALIAAAGLFEFISAIRNFVFAGRYHFRGYVGYGVECLFIAIFFVGCAVLLFAGKNALLQLIAYAAFLLATFINLIGGVSAASVFLFLGALVLCFYELVAFKPGLIQLPEGFMNLLKGVLWFVPAAVIAFGFLINCVVLLVRARGRAGIGSFPFVMMMLLIIAFALFAGVSLAQQLGGASAASVNYFAADGSWTCPTCGRSGITSGFCGSCGTKRPEAPAAPAQAAGAAQGPQEMVKGDGYISITLHVILLFVTFGIWNLIWIYKTTRVLNNVPGTAYRNPVTKLLLCMFVPFYNVYWIYESSKRIDTWAFYKDRKANLATLCTILASVVAFVPPIFMQEYINDLAQLDPVSPDVVQPQAAAQPQAAGAYQYEATQQAAKGEGYFSIELHVILLFITFGIWNLIWIYRTTKVLNNVPGTQYRNPVTKLLLCWFIPFYNIYWIYQSAKRIDEWNHIKNRTSDISTLCTIISSIISFFPAAIMQININELSAL